MSPGQCEIPKQMDSWVCLQDECDNGQNDKDDDQPFGDIHTEPGDSPGAEYRCDEREYQKEDCKLNETSSELQRHSFDWGGTSQSFVWNYHSAPPSPAYVNPQYIHPHSIFE